MSKQDRTYPRTASDLERKYSFGKSFAEAMGLAEDAKTTAEEAKKAASNPSENLTSEEVFNLLTEDGIKQGLYRGDDDDIYFNATYIKSGEINADLIKAGTIDASLIKTGTLDADLIKTGTIAAERIDGGTLNLTSGAKLGGWYISGTSITTADGKDGDAKNTVWLEPARAIYMYNQSAGYGIIATWEEIVKAAGSFGDLEERVAGAEESINEIIAGGGGGGSDPEAVSRLIVSYNAATDTMSHSALEIYRYVQDGGTVVLYVDNSYWHLMRVTTQEAVFARVDEGGSIETYHILGSNGSGNSDHFTFEYLPKSAAPAIEKVWSGSLTSTNSATFAYNTKYSAYLIIARPANSSSNGRMSVTVPRELITATSSLWQVADETTYSTFTLVTDGATVTMTKTNSKGLIEYVYGIR